VGAAQAHTPSTKNYAVEIPTWSILKTYSTTWQQVSSAMACSSRGQPPCWSRSNPSQVSMPWTLQHYKFIPATSPHTWLILWSSLTSRAFPKQFVPVLHWIMSKQYIKLVCIRSQIVQLLHFGRNRLMFYLRSQIVLIFKRKRCSKITRNPLPSEKHG